MGWREAVKWISDHGGRQCDSYPSEQNDMRCSLLKGHKGGHVKVGTVLVDGCYENWCWSDVGELHVEKIFPENQYREEDLAPRRKG
jgi:hypothetical protein